MSAFAQSKNNVSSEAESGSADVEAARKELGTSTSQSSLQPDDDSALPPVDGGTKAWSVIGGAFLALFVQFTSVTQIGDHSGGHSPMTFYPLRGVPSCRLPTRVVTPPSPPVLFPNIATPAWLATAIGRPPRQELLRKLLVFLVG